MCLVSLLLLQGTLLMAQTPPFPALKYGLTHCGFNEEFDHYGGIDINNTGADGYNFYVRVPWRPSRTIDATEASVKKGILTLECNDNASQGDLFSACKLGNTEFNGWYHDMAHGGAVYFEARVRWDYSEIKEDPDGFPAFWANPIEWLDAREDAPYHHYTELDFFEFNPKWVNGKHNIYLQGLPPWQREPGGRWERYINPISEQCIRDNCVIWPSHPASWNYNLTDARTGEQMTSESWSKWQTVGFLVIPGDGTGENPSRCISYFNGKKMKERIDTSWDGDSTWRESKDTLSPNELGFAPMPGMRHHRYMIIIGSGQWKTQWDYVRAWQAQPQPSPPPQAAAEGYDRLVFQEEFDDLSGIDVNDTRKAGFNFYPKLAWGKYVLPKKHIKVKNGVLYLYNPDNHAQSDLFSAVNADNEKGYTGFAIGGGAYFEASIAYDPDYKKKYPYTDGFPAFYSNPVEHFFHRTPQPYNYLEMDHMEYNPKWYDDPNDFQHALLKWSVENNQFDREILGAYPERIINTPDGTDLNKLNTYGALWIPGKNGRFDTYFNNQLLKTRSVKDNPKFRVADDQHYILILGGGQWPIMVNWVRVWSD